MAILAILAFAAASLAGCHSTIPAPEPQQASAAVSAWAPATSDNRPTAPAPAHSPKKVLSAEEIRTGKW
jgi:DNA-binding helix-hairpin-helix protein with protein kinase domain